MAVLDMKRMQEIQRELHRKYKDEWTCPENGEKAVLWAVGEIGEVIDILKKQGSARVIEDPATRKEFVREWVDVMMYMTDVALCFDITPEEASAEYEAKHAYNMKRWE